MQRAKALRSEVLSGFFFQAEDGIRDHCVTGVQTCALPIFRPARLQRCGIAAILRIWPGIALAIDDVQHGAIGADTGGVRVPPGGNQAEELAPCRVGLRELNDRYRVGSAIGHIEVLSIGRYAHAIGAASLEAFRVRKRPHGSCRPNFLEHLERAGADHGNSITARFRYVKPSLLGVQSNSRGLALQGDSSGHHGLVRGNIDNHNLAVACAGYERCAVALDGYPLVILASDGSIAWPQVEFTKNGSSSDVAKADLTILIVC